MKPRLTRQGQLVLASLLLAAPGFAHAQIVGSQNISAQFDETAARDGQFVRRRAVGVPQRPQADYAPRPHPAGALNAYPTLRIQAEATDNLLATPRRQEDLVTLIVPAVRFQSDWTRNALDVFARADLTVHARTSSKNAVGGIVGFNARRDIVRGDALQFGGSLSREVEDTTSLTSVLGLTGPVKFDRAVAYAGGTWTLNRLRWTAHANYDGRRFHDSESPTGSVRLDYRDRDLFKAEARAEYAVNPSVSTFVSVAGNRRDPVNSRPATPGRESAGYAIEGGVNFEHGGLWRGEVGLGFLRQDFENPAYGDTQGLSIHAQIDYFVTQLTNLRFAAERGVEEPGIVLANGFISTRASVEIDHELLRNLVLIGRLEHELSDYGGIDREDRAWSSSLQANYLMNRSVAMIARYRFYSRSSDGVAAIRGFDVHTATVGLTYRF